MKVSTKGRYALRMLVDLAEHDSGGYISLKEISQRQDISLKYLEQIITLLNRAGFVKSIRGPQGGYRLARDPKDYTAGEILRLTEGSLAPIACLENGPNDSDREVECATIDFWEELYDAIKGVVDNTTLEDLIQNKKKRIGYDYYI